MSSVLKHKTHPNKLSIRPSTDRPTDRPTHRMSLSDRRLLTVKVSVCTFVRPTVRPSVNPSARPTYTRRLSDRHRSPPLPALPLDRPSAPPTDQPSRTCPVRDSASLAVRPPPTCRMPVRPTIHPTAVCPFIHPSHHLLSVATNQIHRPSTRMSVRPSAHPPVRFIVHLRAVLRPSDRPSNCPTDRPVTEAHTSIRAPVRRTHCTSVCCPSVLPSAVRSSFCCQSVRPSNRPTVQPTVRPTQTHILPPGSPHQIPSAITSQGDSHSHCQSRGCHSSLALLMLP